MLQRYVLKELFVTFLLTLLAFTLILFFGNVIRNLNKFQGIGLGFMVAVIPYLVPYMLSYTIPFSLLSTSALVYGRLAQDNEIIAIRASGLHTGRAISPAILLGLVLALLCMALNDSIIPECHRKARETTRLFLKRLIADPVAGTRVSEGPELETSEWKIDYSCFENGVIEEVAAIRIEKDQVKEEYYARQGRLSLDEEKNMLILKLVDGSRIDHILDKGKPAWERSVFKEIEVKIAFPFDISRKPRRLSDYTLAELRALAEDPSGVRWSRAEILTELNSKLALSVSPVVFVLLGAPLGISIRRRSRLLSLAVSVFIILAVYYPTSLLGQTLSINETVPPEVGCWWANAILLLPCLFLLRRT